MKAKGKGKKDSFALLLAGVTRLGTFDSRQQADDVRKLVSYGNPKLGRGMLSVQKAKVTANGLSVDMCRGHGIMVIGR